jgi:hypothetical protein
MHLSTLSRDIRGEEHAAYRSRVIEYVDSVFSEVRCPRSRDKRSGTSDMPSRTSTKEHRLLRERRGRYRQRSLGWWVTRLNSRHCSRRRQTSVPAPPKSTRTAQRA